MRIANVAGRATVITSAPGEDLVGLDVEKASDGRFPADPQAVLEQWDDVRAWGEGRLGRGDIAIDRADLGAPTPAPRQVFAIGLNYGDHIDESKMGRPPAPAVFTKFPSSITGPDDTVVLPSANVDWEVELVVAIGRRAYEVDEAAAWDHVAGLMVGQDLSERVVQLIGPVPQFSLGKSYPGFAPVGPYLVTPDEVPNRDDLELGCGVGDEVLQLGRTSSLIFDVPELVAKLSAVCPLLPGDIIFTGTPSGVGNAREPKRFLEPGQLLRSHIEGVGELRNPMVAGPHHPSVRGGRS
ncbi:fumarylacetoacetate hydrolase family protein [Jatrophihabitans fulvus]